MSHAIRLSDVRAWRPVATNTWRHFRRHWLPYALGLGILVGGSRLVTFEINTTESLQGTLFVVLKTGTTVADLRRGDYVTYLWHGEARIPKGIHFTKIVQGVPGDLVTTEGRTFFVNGVSAGVAKEWARGGWMKLELGPTGVIPQGQVYVKGTHADSLDSRYAISGWIRESAIVGRAYKVF